MMVLVTYDVETITAKGRKRLRLVAKECLNFGQRVQNSVFECVVNESQLLILESSISNIIDFDVDSIRFYRLGKGYEDKIKVLGKVTSYSVAETLII
ncbi:MAG: CRISPR-associated endonuclease Cas2 [Rikenellaceae bacterium]